MAVGKGSMARASKAAGKKAETKATVAANVDENAAEVVMEAVTAEQETETLKPELKKTAAKKTAAKKTATKKVVTEKAVSKTEKGAKASAVIEATSEQVMKQIVYQKSSQVLDREAEVNETFGVGEAMPIYFF